MNDATDRPAAALSRMQPRRWLASRGWKPFAFQREVWDAIGHGESGLIHATTGAGKTYAVWLGALTAFDARPAKIAPPLTVLWITPMRALAADTTRALTEPIEDLQLGWTIGVRSGDTSSAERARQTKRLPTTLVTTPESLTLFLTQPDWPDRFGSVRLVVVDEWHELIGNKRGVQVQLALARLRARQPHLATWGLSATLGNTELALEVLVGAPGVGRLVRGNVAKSVVIDTLIPPTMARFPWAGHLGTNLVREVAAEIDTVGTTLVFTNTRSQAEIWYQALLEARPEWAGLLALHHGSLDRTVRDWVEQGLKAGTLKAVVCTSSLDLGVDFLPVDRVLQLGSPKGIARLLQRAGRSGHAPGRVSRVTCVPTQALELLESAAARRAARAGHIEARRPPSKPLDVLVQHLVTAALGGGFELDAMLSELRSTHAYRTLSDLEFRWTLDFVVRGGSSLVAYPEYHRVTVEADGRHIVADRAIARRHRMSIGTIVSDASMDVKWYSGGRIGSIEESFIAMLKRGDSFLFGGRVLELVRVHEMSALVRVAKTKQRIVPRWNGGKMPLSNELAGAVMALLEEARSGALPDPELRALAPLLDVQRQWSRIPATGELLIERVKTREGHHFFCFPFGGRLVHLGLANLVAWRVTRERPMSFSICVNDYGFELLSPEPIDWEGAIGAGLFRLEQLDQDVFASLNEGELAKRRFREIARIAGLVFQGYPGQPKSARQIQASSGLFFDVFQNYDPENLLLAQAKREVMEQELELARLHEVLERISRQTILIIDPPRPTPFAFPLMVERIREKFSNERVADRVARMVAELEAAADHPAVATRPRSR